MKIKTRQIITNYMGDQLTNKEGDPLTFAAMASVALNSQAEGEVLDAATKERIYRLTVKLMATKEVDLSLDERAFLKERAAKTLLPLTYGRLCDILEK